MAENKDHNDNDSGVKSSIASLVFASGLAVASVYYGLLKPNFEARERKETGIETRLEYDALPSLKTDNIYQIIDDFDARNRDFYRAVIKVESSDNPKAVSKAGARGLMQIMPQTWKDMTDSNYDAAFEPRTNVEFGIKYFHWIHDYLEKRVEGWENLERKDKLRLMLAAYNGGVGNLKKNNWQTGKMPAETQNYVSKVLSQLEKLEDAR